MAHRVDFSASNIGMYTSNNGFWTGFQGFGSEVWTDMTWNSHGVLYEEFRYRTPYGTETAWMVYRPHTAWPEPYAKEDFNLADFDPGPVVLPPGLTGARNKFVVATTPFNYSSSGAYLVLEGVAGPKETFGPKLDQIFDSFEQAGDFAYHHLVEEPTHLLLAPLEVLEKRRMAEVGPLRIETWSDDPLRPDDSMVFTPDPDSNLTLGEVLDFDSPYAPGRQAHVGDPVAFFRGEDVEIILTRHNDMFLAEGVSGNAGLAANRLKIDAGDGDDNVSIFVDRMTGWNSLEDMPLVATVLGGAGDDTINLEARSSAHIFGGAGHDLLWGSAPTVHINGDAGDDFIWGGSSLRSTLYGGGGADTITGSPGRDTAFGGAGNDFLTDAEISYRDRGKTITLSATADNVFYGGGGDDDVWGGGGTDMLYGGTGSDTLYGNTGDDIMYGGKGRDYFMFYDRDGSPDFGYPIRHYDIGDQTVRDTGGMILLWSNDSSEHFGADGLTRIGNDLILGDIGRSSLRITDYYKNPAAWSAGETRSDGPPMRLSGLVDWKHARNLENEVTLGTNRADKITMKGPGTLAARDGNDTVNGSRRADSIFGDDGNDVLRGRGGNDTLFGGHGNDQLRGQAGRDQLFGGAGNDMLRGDGGADTLQGGDGDDRLFGGAGTDRLFGSTGNDRLEGGRGADVLTGGRGADTFVFTKGHGKDRITDFDPLGLQDGYLEGYGDRLALSSGLWRGDLSAEQVVSRFVKKVGDSLELDFGQGNTIRLTGFDDRGALVTAIDIIA